MKKKVSAILLALFFGGLGANDFYLGNIGTGFLKLIFCWTYIPSFIALIQMVKYIVMSDDEFNKTYNK